MSATTSGPLRAEIEQVLIDAGLDAVGFTTVDAFPAVRRSLESRRAAGQHAGMSFTFRNPQRSTEPDRLLRRAASMVVGALGYVEPEPPRPAGPAARVARYAWRDHYADLRTALDAGVDVLRAGGHRATVVTDQNGLVDRAAAHRAGIGWWGRNSNLLIPGAGSWFVLGSIVTDAELPELPEDSEPVPDGCRSCTRCIEACPTAAIVDDGVIDARRCLAWLVQDTGVFPRAFRVALGDRLYGCDDCQDACPPGRRTIAEAVPVVIDRHRHLDAWVPVLELLEATDEALIDRYGRWYIPNREVRYLRRNALIVLGNVGDGTDAAQRALVARYVRDDDPLLRAHAVWTAARLGLDDLVRAADTDPDAVVRAEVAMSASVAPAPGPVAALRARA
ncbi:MAG: tRNA epoxyqueuosine(34) reductase QueG [Acidimicrobiales bacterium]